MQWIGQARVEVALPVIGATSVEIVGYQYSALGHAGEIRFCFFDREDLIEQAVRRLTWEAFGGEVDAADEAAARQHVGARIWSRLYPDVGIGRASSLGRRRIDDDYFDFLRAQYRLGSTAPVETVLEQVGRARWPGTVPSFRAVKNEVHFIEADLPQPLDVVEAEQFLADFSAELAEEEQDRAGDRRWQARPAAGSRGKQPKPTTELDRRLRRVAERFVRQRKASPGVMHAVTLLSYAHRLRVGNWVARHIAAALPDGTLDDLSHRVLEMMYIGEKGHDERGRFDLPIMASRAVASAVEQLGGFGDTGKTTDLMDELLAFIGGASRCRAVDVCLGFAATYQSWAAWQRGRDQDKKHEQRTPLLQPREDELAVLPDVKWYSGPGHQQIDADEPATG